MTSIVLLQASEASLVFDRNFNLLYSLTVGIVETI